MSKEGWVLKMKSKKLFSLWKNPIRYVWSYWIFQNLPLMWRVNIANKHMGYMMWKRRFMDQKFGTLEVVVSEVLLDWQEISLEHGVYRFRDIKYRMKRSKLPWYSTKLKLGTQHCDEETYPFIYSDHQSLAKTLDESRGSLKELQRRNAARNAFFNPVEVNK
uniref:Uncharacterized protein n=1 Tax=Pantoea phage Survivor TaxID=3232176 RepID=A0AAU8L0J3_9CAUD